MLFYTLAFILLLGPLVFIHEFGHFLFAKLFNVRVDVFSLGFGPKLLAKQWGETQYCISAIPLGGYVKLYGQDPTEVVDQSTKDRALNNQESWKRFLVFVAGPLFNFLFAIFIFAFILVLGEPHISPVIQRVIPGSQAQLAGFREGAVITAINRKIVNKLEEVLQTISESPSKELTFRMKQHGQLREIKSTPQPKPGLSIYGESLEVGEIEGLYPFGRHTVIGVSNPKSIAAKLNLKTGDEVVTINGQALKSYEAFETKAKEIIEQAKIKKKQTALILGVIPHEINYWTTLPRVGASASQTPKEVHIPLKNLDEIGIFSSELFILSTIKDSPIEKAGLLPGDKLITVEGIALPSFQTLKELVQKAGATKGKFELTYERHGKTHKAEIVPTVQNGKDITGKEVKQYLMGVYPLFVQNEPEMFLERIFNPFTITIEAWARALDLSVKTFVSLKKLAFREVSVGTLGGPILIGKFAGDSMARGLAHFLKAMALISISLAIFNILPIPILDGGHVFLLLIEVIRGKPMSIKSNEVIQQVGLTLIMLLLVVVLFNDISKVGIPALKQMFQ